MFYLFLLLLVLTLVYFYFLVFFLFVRSLKAAIIESQSTKFVPLPAPNTAKLAEVIYQEGGLL